MKGNSLGRGSKMECMKVHEQGHLHVPFAHNSTRQNGCFLGGGPLSLWSLSHLMMAALFSRAGVGSVSE